MFMGLKSSAVGESETVILLLFAPTTVRYVPYYETNFVRLPLFVKISSNK